MLSARRMRSASVLLFGCALLAGGCVEAFGDKDAHQPGEPLGSFHVVAKQTANGCGEGALGSTASWSFDVKLSKDQSQLFWNNGEEIVVGTLSGDGSFAFTSGVEMDMRSGASGEGGGSGGPKLPPCSIDRTDTASGALEGGADVTGFQGKLSYGFAPTTGSSCGDLVSGPSAAFATLPCSMTYALTATKTAPAE